MASLKYGWGLFFGDEDGGEMLDAALPKLTLKEAERQVRRRIGDAVRSGFPDATLLRGVVFDQDGEPVLDVTCRRLHTWN